MTTEQSIKDRPATTTPPKTKTDSVEQFCEKVAIALYGWFSSDPDEAIDAQDLLGAKQIIQSQLAESGLCGIKETRKPA